MRLDNACKTLKTDIRIDMLICLFYTQSGHSKFKTRHLLFYIDRGDKGENEFVFDKLLQSKVVIEERFEGVLEWERLDEKRGCRIKAKSEGNVFERERWNEMIDFMTSAMCSLESSIKAPLKEVGIQVKNYKVTDKD